MLLDILNDIASDDGINLDDADERALVITRVNQAAKELYTSSDLPNSLDEGVFDLNVSMNQVALPWYIDVPRAMRYADGGSANVELNSMRNRYGAGIDAALWPLKIRQKRELAINRSIENESTIILSIPLPELLPFKVTIIGETFNANRNREVITFLPGDLEKESIGNYRNDINVIRKSRTTLSDLTVYDIEENEIAFIPNAMLQARYQIFQLYDCRYNITTPVTNGVEIVYKKSYIPLAEDEDEFICGNDFDKAIYWKYMEQQSKDTLKALAFQIKCTQILDQIEANFKSGIREKVEFVNRGFNNLSRYIACCSRTP